MKSFAALFKIQLRSLIGSLFAANKKQKKGTRIALGILLGFLFLYVFVVFCGMFAGLSAILVLSLQEAGESQSFFFAVVAFAAFLLCVFGSVFATQSTLYSAKDNELLLSLPLTPAAILATRALLLAIVNYLFGAVVILPAFVVYLLLGAPTLGGVLAFLLVFFLVPLIALAVSCLLGWLLALISSRIKRKNLVTLICSLLFFGLYMFVMLNMQTVTEELAIDILAIRDTVAPFLTVFWWVGYAIADGNILAGLGFFLLSLAIVGTVAYFLIRTYFRIITTNRGGVRYVYREKREEQRGVMSALIRKEIRHFTGNAMYMFNEGIGLLFAPILGVMLLLNRDTVTDFLTVEELAPFMNCIPAMLGAALCFLSSMTIISAPSVSLEGKSLWLSQSLPVHPKQVLLSKVYTHILLATPFYLLTSVLAIVALPCTVLDAVMLLLFPFAANAFCAYLGVFFNVLFPKFDWLNETVAVKSGASVLLTMLVMMVIAILVDAAVVMLSIIGIPSFFSLLLGTVVFGILSLGIHLYLAGAGARRFAHL